MRSAMRYQNYWTPEKQPSGQKKKKKHISMLILGLKQTNCENVQEHKHFLRPQILQSYG